MFRIDLMDWENAQPIRFAIFRRRAERAPGRQGDRYRSVAA